MPWLAIDGAGDEFYGGLMWSGGWTLTTARTDAGSRSTGASLR